jgi:hypothetical protein
MDPRRVNAGTTIAKRQGVPFTPIGRVTARAGEVLVREPGGALRPLAEIAGGGFDHFRAT